MTSERWPVFLAVCAGCPNGGGGPAGQVDAGVLVCPLLSGYQEAICIDPPVALGDSEECPLSYADARCCGASHALSGTILWQGASPAVMVRRRDTGAVRTASTCADSASVRFRLVDEDFMVPGAEYAIYLLDPEGGCESYVVTTDVTTSAVCVELP